MSTALLVEYFNQIPECSDQETPQDRRKRQAATAAFKKRAARRYTEGTLLRLLESPDRRTRRAALLALGLLGSMGSSEAVAVHLHDEDAPTSQAAADALWSLWFRADAPDNNNELQRLMRLDDRDKALAGLDALIQKAPGFAEAYNQRAILYFRLKKYPQSIADCEKVLQLNPQHFAALSGMGQCYLQLRKHRAALKVFRHALRINPHLDGVAETVRALENALGEEGRRDDKK